MFEDKADNFWKFVIICPQNYQLMSAAEVNLKGLVKVELTEDHANRLFFNKWTLIFGMKKGLIIFEQNFKILVIVFKY